MKKFFTIGEISEIAQDLLRISEENNYTIIAFYGKMGSGKTTLIKEICRQIGVIDIVQSPTFAIINQYQKNNGDYVYHFDFYRLDKIEDAISLGIEEIFYSGDMCLIEWPEIIEPLLPENTLKVNLNIIDKQKREIIINVTEKSFNNNTSI